MKNIKPTQLKNCIFLSTEEFESIFKEITKDHQPDEDVYVEFDTCDGIYFSDISEETVLSKLSEYFGTTVTSIHLDQYDKTGVWICYKESTKYNYIINLTFYAGSNDPEDTDNELVLFSSDKPYTKNEMVEIIRKANRLLNWFEDDDDEEDNEDNEQLSLSYNDGLNINTLIEGVRELTGAEIVNITDMTGQNVTIADAYVIEQWQ